MIPIRAIPLLAAALIAGGCSLERLPDQASFTLAAPDLAGMTAGAERRTIRVTRAQLAAPYGVRSLQYRVADDRFEADYYEQWAADPGTLISAAIIEAFASSGLFELVVDDASRVTAPETLELYVAAMYLDAREHGTPRAVLELRATLISGGGEPVFSRDYVERMATDGAGGAAAVRAWNGALALVARSLAADLAALPGDEPHGSSDGSTAP